MLGRKDYERAYVAYCGQKLAADVKAFEELKTVSEALETSFFNNMVLVLEQMFVHRIRGVEGKDGNPLNEVRMIANSMLTNNNKLLADKTIKYNASKAVLGISIGEPIKISRDDFLVLSKAFLSEIENKFCN